MKTTIMERKMDLDQARKAGYLNNREWLEAEKELRALWEERKAKGLNPNGPVEM